MDSSQSNAPDAVEAPEVITATKAVETTEAAEAPEVVETTAVIKETNREQPTRPQHLQDSINEPPWISRLRDWTHHENSALLGICEERMQHLENAVQRSNDINKAKDVTYEKTAEAVMRIENTHSRDLRRANKNLRKAMTALRHECEETQRLRGDLRVARVETMTASRERDQAKSVIKELFGLVVVLIAVIISLSAYLFTG
ncbi:hypothetical protein F5Y05DRAFT_415842 [Hypoxylon sp. FL0543]|nr:hypothetical protein F5Y05DRAFT_415842 [Hypoxylon sp. FL0543]